MIRAGGAEVGAGGGGPAHVPLTRYRLAMLLAILFVFALQKFIAFQKPYALARLLKVDDLNLLKMWLGVLVSFLLVVVLMEYAWAFIPRLVRERSWFRPRVHSLAYYESAIYLLASLFLFGDLQGRLLRGFIPVQPSPPLATALVWMLVWVALFAATSRLKAWLDVDLARFLFLIGLTRLTMYSCVPFEAIYADMLRTIDRSLGLLLAGAFPYIDAPPPPMPYWPLTFLAYLPTRLMGWDLRATNLVVDLATVVVALRFGIDRRDDPRRTIAARLWLPLLMLYRTWAGFSVDTQYPISVLFAVLFARSLATKGAATQAVILGSAVAANQTFGIFGPFVLPFWIRRYGPRRAARMTLIAASTCLAFIAPFVLWNAKEFFRVTLLSLKPFPASFLAGQFSIRPLVEGAFPNASLVLIGLTVVVVGVLNWFQVDRARIAATTAIGYCVFLLLLHRTFTHYYLPVMAMVVCLNYETSESLDDRPRS